MIIDAHLHLWEKQSGCVNGKPVFALSGGKVILAERYVK